MGECSWDILSVVSSPKALHTREQSGVRCALLEKATAQRGALGRAPSANESQQLPIIEPLTPTLSLGQLNQLLGRISASAVCQWRNGFCAQPRLIGTHS